MTLDHRQRGVEATESTSTPGEIEVLIKEARERQRRRYFNISMAVIVLVGVAFSSWLLLRSSLPSSTKTVSEPSKHQVATIPALAGESRVWTLDMLNGVSGYAVAGLSSSEHDELLIKTANAGASWTVVGKLPYPYVSNFTKPLLQFVTPSIGYTRALSEGPNTDPDDLYVTTNGGKSWSQLSIKGQLPTTLNTPVGASTSASTSPDIRISQGVVSLVSSQCAVSSLENAHETCPSTLSQYRLGATSPFSIRRITWAGLNRNSYLLAAGPRGAVLLARDRYNSSTPPFDLSTNGGRTWSLVEDPCKPYHFDGGVEASGVNLTPTRWMLNCSQDTGMNHATVTLSETTDEGRSWTTVNFTPSSSEQPGAIEGQFDEVWASNGGKVFWSYSLVGFVQVSTDGGRTWSPIEVNGRPSNANLGGGPIEFAPVGPTGAYFLMPGGQVLLSRDGGDFKAVRLLRKVSR